MMKWSPTTDDDLRAEIKARKAPPMTDRTMEALSWKPIETAPKDRGELLVKRGSRLHLVSWFDCWRYDGAPRPGWVMDGGHIVEPTHWLASEADLVALTPSPPAQEGEIAEVLIERLQEAATTVFGLTAEECRQAAAELSRLSALVGDLRDQAHYATGTAELAMKHRDEAEALVKAQKEVLEPFGAIARDWESSNGWSDSDEVEILLDTFLIARLRAEHFRRARTLIEESK